MLLLRLIAEKEIRIDPDRQRQEFDPEALAELTDSIRRVGLIHPIVLSNGNTLRAGERRIRAIKDLWFTGDKLRCGGIDIPEGMIPFLDFGDLDELDRAELEYDENVRRTDLTWDEKSKATALLESIRRRRAESRGEPPPTVADLSEEVRGSSEGKAHETTRRELIISKHLGDPEVSGARSLDEAWKILKRREETRRNVALAASVGKTFSADLHSAHNPLDSLDWMRGFEANSFDVILTDPPYGMGADEFGDSGVVGRRMNMAAHSYNDSYGYWQEIMRGFPELAFRVTKPQAHIYVFCDIDRFHELRKWMNGAGWKCHRTPLVWHKPDAIRAPWPEHGPHRKYELILYAMKGDKPVTRLYPDVVSYPTDTNLGSGAQKPVALYVDLLKRSVGPGDTVLDPFMGTGTIFPAAHELKCIATGADKDPAVFGIAVKRLEQLKAQKEMGL